MSFRTHPRHLTIAPVAIARATNEIVLRLTSPLAEAADFGDFEEPLLAIGDEDSLRVVAKAIIKKLLTDADDYLAGVLARITKGCEDLSKVASTIISNFLDMAGSDIDFANALATAGYGRHDAVAAILRSSFPKLLHDWTEYVIIRGRFGELEAWQQLLSEGRDSAQWITKKENSHGRLTAGVDISLVEAREFQSHTATARDEAAKQSPRADHNSDAFLLAVREDLVPGLDPDLLPDAEPKPCDEQRDLEVDEQISTGQKSANAAIENMKVPAPAAPSRKHELRLRDLGGFWWELLPPDSVGPAEKAKLSENASRILQKLCTLRPGEMMTAAQIFSREDDFGPDQKCNDGLDSLRLKRVKHIGLAIRALIKNDGRGGGYYLSSEAWQPPRTPK